MVQTTERMLYPTATTRSCFTKHTPHASPEVTPGRDGMVPSAAATRCLQRAHIIRTLPGLTGALNAFLSLVTLNFDLNIQSRPSEGPNTSFV